MTARTSALLAAFALAAAVLAATGCNNKAEVDAKGPSFPPPADADLAKLPETGSTQPPAGDPANAIGTDTPTGPGPGTGTGTGVEVVDAPPAPPAQPTGPRIHVAVKGDTYYSLARTYYDDPTLHRKIQDANPGIPATKIPVGARLTIPD